MQQKLLDHLVGAPEQRKGKGEAERLCSFEVDNQLHLCCLLHRDFGGLFTFKDPARVYADLTRKVHCGKGMPGLSPIKVLV